MTPIALDALMERAQIRREESRWLAAGIKAEIWNVNLDRKEHPESLTAADFMPPTPEELAEREREMNRVPTKEEIEAYKQRLFGARYVAPKP
jgi:hypothetical protein